MKSKVAALVMVVGLGAFLTFWWQSRNGREGGEGESAAGSPPPAKGSAAGPGAGSHAGAAKTERRPAGAKRDEPLDLDILQNDLAENAKKVIVGNIGDEAAKSRVLIELEKLKGFKQAGMGDVHPNVVISRLRLAKEVDLVGDSDSAAGEARLIGYLDGLQSAAEGRENGQAVDDLLTRWRQELKREDSFEAAVIASLGTGLTKEGLEGRLKFFRNGISPPVQEGGEPSDPEALKGR